MASIISKKVNGGTYYYLREMARVGGKPKMVSERYLGKAEDIEAAMAGATVLPERTRHLAFGDLAAACRCCGASDSETGRRVIGGRRDDAAASVGTYVELMVANRVVAPCSKLAFRDWWATTAGDRLVKLPPSALDHRRFWEAMDALDDETLSEIHRLVVTRMVDEFALSAEGLVLDMTNVSTYVDSANERNTIARRGHAKNKRHDLRIVGLSLVVTKDGAVPIASHAYPGNRPDVTQFATAITRCLASSPASASPRAHRRLRRRHGLGRQPRLLDELGCTSSPRSHRTSTPSSSRSEAATTASSTRPPSPA